MSFRTLVIKERAKLDYKMNYLTVRKEEETVRININEIYMLIIESTAVSLTAVLLNELVKNKVQVIFCDEKRNPISNLISLYGAHDTSLKYKIQISWEKEAVESVWTTIVHEKITQQKIFLKQLGKDEHKLLESYIEEIEYNDKTNREGHSAKVYFNALFGKDFTRSQESIINYALDYGYAILLSAFNREIIASGYATQLGIFHNNQYNQFNLSCDLMEPFRILIDREVYKLTDKEFGKETKVKLIKILQKNIFIDGKKQTVANAIKIYTQSVLRALSNSDINLIKNYTYEL